MDLAYSVKNRHVINVMNDFISDDCIREENSI